MFNIARKFAMRAFIVAAVPISATTVYHKHGYMVTEKVTCMKDKFNNPKVDLPFGKLGEITIKYHTTSYIQNILKSIDQFNYNTFVERETYVIIDYDNISSIDGLKYMLNKVKSGRTIVTTVIICNTKSYLDLDYYNDLVFNCLSKFKNQMKIVYLCENKSMHPQGNYYEDEYMIYAMYDV